MLHGLPAPVVNELGPLLQQFARLWLSLDGEIELRPAELDETRLSGRRAELANALVLGRLVVADQGKLRIVHEAVLRNWDRARDLLAADLDLARLKAQLEPLVADWVVAGRNPNDAARMLPAGAQLGAADAAAKRYPVEHIGEDLAAFIAASVEFERRQRTRRQRILTTAAAAFAGLSMLAIAGGIFAWKERGVATAALDISEQNYRLAITQAAGSVRSLADSYEAGGVSTVLMRELIDKAQATVANLPKGGDDVVVAQAKLLGVLTIGNMTLGNIPAARQYADQERALADGLVANPTNVEWRRLWAGARVHSAEVMFWQGDLLEAVELTRPAIDAAARLAAADPTNDDLQADLIRLYQNLGDNLRQNGDVEDADKAYHAWLAAAEAESAREPDDPRWQRFLAFGHGQLADDLVIMDKPAEAAKQYAVMADIGSKLVARDAGNGLYVEAASLAQLRLGDTYLMQGQLAEAEVRFRRALAEISALLDIDPTNYRWRSFVKSAHQRLGQTALRRSDFATADSEFATYLKMAKETLRKDRANNWALYNVAEAQLEVGDALREEGKFEEALNGYHQSLALVEELNRRLSTNPPWQKLLAAAHQRLGLVLEAQGNREDAIAEFRTCAGIPVRSTIWSSRLQWPKDVDGYCRDQLTRLRG